MTDNADLIAETREGFRVAVENGWARAADAPTLAMRLAERLEAVEQRAAELAAVVEEVREFCEDIPGVFRFEAGRILDLLTTPADVLRELKAEAWDEGADAMAEHIDNGAWWEIQNPYQEEQS